MSPTRERLRRAASVVVLVAAVGVLVATSPPADDTSGDRFNFDAVSFDADSEMLAGRIGSIDIAKGRWRQRSVELTVRGDAPGARLMAQIVDSTGHEVAAIAGLGPELRVTAVTSCSDDACRDPVAYRVQRLDGGAVAVGVSVDVTFTATTDEDQPDVSVEISPPEAVRRSDEDRRRVLATTTLQVDPDQRVDAAWLSWTSESCGGTAALQATIANPMRSDPVLRVLDGEGARGVVPILRDRLSAIGTTCTRLSSGERRHSALIVLGGQPLPARTEVWFIGSAGLGPVDVTPAVVQRHLESRLRGSGGQALDRRLEPSSGARDRFTAFLLHVEPRDGIRVRISGGTLKPVADRAVCHRCAVISVDVSLRASPGTPSAEVEATAEFYEIRVPGS